MTLMMMMMIIMGINGNDLDDDDDDDDDMFAQLEQYQGSRSHEDLKNFVTRKVDEVSNTQQEAVPEAEEEVRHC